MSCLDQRTFSMRSQGVKNSPMGFLNAWEVPTFSDDIPWQQVAIGWCDSVSEGYNTFNVEWFVLRSISNQFSTPSQKLAIKPTYFEKSLHQKSAKRLQTSFGVGLFLQKSYGIGLQYALIAGLGPRPATTCRNDTRSLFLLCKHSMGGLLLHLHAKAYGNANELEAIIFNGTSLQPEAGGERWCWAETLKTWLLTRDISSGSFRESQANHKEDGKNKGLFETSLLIFTDHFLRFQGDDGISPCRQISSNWD